VYRARLSYIDVEEISIVEALFIGKLAPEDYAMLRLYFALLGGFFALGVGRRGPDPTYFMIL
jgi:hypothetical protein